jgi:hypothetical protein
MLAIVIVMQLASAAIAAVSMRGNQNEEQTALLKLNNDLLQYHVVIADYELTVAASNVIEDTNEYQKVKVDVAEDLDRLIELNQAHPERIETYENQKKLFEASDKVLQLLKETTNKRVGGGAGSDRFALLVIMLGGMRKLDRIAHKMHDDMADMIATMPKSSTNSGTLGIVALVLSLASVALLAQLMVKGPTSY